MDPRNLLPHAEMQVDAECDEMAVDCVLSTYIVNILWPTTVLLYHVKRRPLSHYADNTCKDGSA